MQNQNLEKQLIIISAPSGSGKSTIIQELLKKQTNLAFSVSTTTRNPRPNEKNGVHYHFVKEEDFLQKIQNKEFLEWAKVHNQYYGTTKKEITRLAQENKLCLLDIDVQGAVQILKTYPYCKSIFILPPSIKELQNRLTKRGDTSFEQIELRLKNAIKELKLVHYYQYFVVNDVLENAILKVQEIINE